VDNDSDLPTDPVEAPVMRLPRVRFTGRRMIVSIAAFAVLLVLERFLFIAAFKALPSPYHPTGHVVTAETYLLWMGFNGAAVAVLSPIIFATKVTGCFTLTSRGWGSRLRCLATALFFGFAGTVIGVVVGFVLGLIVGYAVDPSGPNPHNYGGLLRGLATVAIMVVGAYIGFVVGVVRYSRLAR
jgi:hypothetical protein